MQSWTDSEYNAGCLLSHDCEYIDWEADQCVNCSAISKLLLFVVFVKIAKDTIRRFCFINKQENEWTPDEAVQYIKQKRPHIWLRVTQFDALNKYFTDNTKTS